MALDKQRITDFGLVVLWATSTMRRDRKQRMATPWREAAWPGRSAGGEDPRQPSLRRQESWEFGVAAVFGIGQLLRGAQRGKCRSQYAGPGSRSAQLL